jgi:hypothetical protein
MKGLWKLTNAAQRHAAWRDWQAISRFAHANGYGEYADALKTADNAGRRKIDRKIAELRKFMQSGGLVVPQNPSAGE